MLIGYSRVSTDEQDSALQRDALITAGCERIFDETMSGARSDRPELKAALDFARKGDVIAGRYRVDAIAVDGADVFDLVLGTISRLKLHA